VDEHNGKSIRIYPNPSKGSFQIVPQGLGNENLTVTVLDMTERSIQTQTIPGDQKIIIDLSAYPQGCYIIKVQTGSEVIVKRLIVERY
jgi:hypothetical protein